MFLNVFLALEDSINFLCGNEDNTRVAFREFLVSGLKLSQLPLAVWSPGAADEDERQRFPAIVGKADDFPTCIWQFKVRRSITNPQSIGSSLQHGFTPLLIEGNNILDATRSEYRRSAIADRRFVTSIYNSDSRFVIRTLATDYTDSADCIREIRVIGGKVS